MTISFYFDKGQLKLSLTVTFTLTALLL